MLLLKPAIDDVYAGFFLFAVQPFKLGDRVAVSYSSPAVGGGPPNSAWFEGIAEKTDLRCPSLPNPHYYRDWPFSAGQKSQNFHAPYGQCQNATIQIMLDANGLSSFSSWLHHLCLIQAFIMTG